MLLPVRTAAHQLPSSASDLRLCNRYYSNKHTHISLVPLCSIEIMSRILAIASRATRLQQQSLVGSSFRPHAANRANCFASAHQQDRAWVDMRLHEYHEQGGFGVTHNTVSRRRPHKHVRKGGSEGGSEGAREGRGEGRAGGREVGMGREGSGDWKGGREGD
jgi:hypothetical protein